MSLLGLFDYPKEIKQLESQIPATDRAAFLSRYKKLSKNDKTGFKQALRSADIDAANKILGEDLNQYHVTLDKQAAKKNAKTKTVIKGKSTVALINASVAAPIDEKPMTPVILPAEAARRYAVFANSISVTSAPPSPKTVTASTAGQLSDTSTPAANETKVYRIDSSGIFAIPDNISSDRIKSVLVNGKPIGQDQYAITENGNLDIFEADKDSNVSIVL